MTIPAAVRFTYADYKNLPEESRYEILDGDLLMSPSPTMKHQRIVGNLYRLLATFVADRKLGEAFVSPCDVILTESDVVQPDVFFVAKSRLSIIKEKAVRGAPDLVIEVLSPGTADRDRTVKAKLYARAGVRELWLVDPDSRTFQLLTLGPAGFEPQSPPGALGKSKVLKGFEVDASQLF